MAAFEFLSMSRDCLISCSRKVSYCSNCSRIVAKAFLSSIVCVN